MISLFSTFILVSATVVSIDDSKLHNIDLGCNNVPLFEQSLVRRTSGEDRSREDISPQRTNRGTNPVFYERPRPPPRHQRIVPQTSRGISSGETTQIANSPADPHRVPDQIPFADSWRTTGNPPGLSRPRPQVSGAGPKAPYSSLHDSRRFQSWSNTSRQSNQRKDPHQSSEARSLGQHFSRLQLEKTIPSEYRVATTRPRPPLLKNQAPVTGQKSPVSLQSAESSRISRSSPKKWSTPSIFTDNPFAKLARSDSPLVRSSSSSSSSSPRKTSISNTHKSKVSSRSTSPSPLERKALDTRRTISLKKSSSKDSNQGPNPASGNSNEGLQDQGGTSKRSSGKSKGKSKDIQQGKVRDKGVQSQSQRQQIDDRPQDSIGSLERTETAGTRRLARTSSQPTFSYHTTQPTRLEPIDESPIPINMRRKWGGTTAQGIVEPGRPDDAIDRIKKHPGIWAHAGIHAEGPSQVGAATSSEWTPWVHAEPQISTRAFAHHPRLAFAQGESKTIRNQQGKTIGKGSMGGKASGDHIWGFFQPGTTSPIWIDWDKGDGRKGSMLIPPEPISQGATIIGQSLNANNSSANRPSFTAHTHGSGELSIFAKMGSSPLKNGELFFEQKQEEYDTLELTEGLVNNF